MILFGLCYNSNMRINNIKITHNKVDKLSDISISIAQVLFATLFIEPLIGNNVNWVSVFFGFLVAVGLWIFSIMVVK